RRHAARWPSLKPIRLGRGSIAGRAAPFRPVGSGGSRRVQGEKKGEHHRQVAGWPVHSRRMKKGWSRAPSPQEPVRGGIEEEVIHVTRALERGWLFTGGPEPIAPGPSSGERGDRPPY